VSALAGLVQDRLAQGPMPAAEAMELALYHPEHGYYRRSTGPWGFEGADYYTALDLGPLLGEALAVRFAQAWERMGRPGQFVVLEAGAGRGWLGRDLLAAAQGPFRDALHYIHRDDNPAARAAAREALAPHLAAGTARFADEDEVLEPFQGAVLSNELFDALPAQPWRWDGEGWRFEALGPEGQTWLPGGPCEATEWFTAQAEGGLEPGDGAPWCQGLPRLVESLGAPLAKGLFLTIDYGDAASRLVDKGADIRRFRGHQVDGSWWEDMGSADLTADVDFTRLAAHLEGAGFREAGHVSLSRWVRAHAPLAQWEADWQAMEPALRVKRMENLLQLTLPSMMGERFRVLEAWKNCD